MFDARSNRIDGARDGYDVLDQTFDGSAKDRMTGLCWWRSFLNPGECFVGYSYGYNATGAMTQMNGLKGTGTAWNLAFDYPVTNALSDVYSSVTKTVNGGAPVVTESFYDAFGRRRAKWNAVSDGQEFLYDLGHQLLVDSIWKTSASSVTADEYVWLDGRPVLVVRSNLTAKGGHKTDSVDDLDTGAGNCSRPIDDGQVNCGLFHLVSNLQGFVNVAIHDGTGLVASVMLPDADGTVNQPRMMAAGTNGTAWAQRFNVPTTFSKQARFRTSWTGGLPGWGGGVDSFELGGQTVLTGGPTTELGQAWSSWSPTVTGSTDVVWSTTCANGCMSAADLFEWRTWETGAARFQTRLRFPGQYADAETGFYENWNRYYDPPTGRYWSPEPMLQSPHFVRVLARRGASLPAYGYAANNPVFYFDPTGLDPKKTYRSEDEAGKAALQWIRDTKTPSQLRLREYCGQVRRTKDGKFRHDELTAGPPRSETRATCASGPKADDSVGPFHSHPWTSDFSDDDIELCNDRQSPGYLLGPDGKMFKYNPTIIPGPVPTVDRSVKNITPLGNTRPY